ncbi:hypothetical protein EYR40_010168 [Pleurotus pulmonarius]|nr:hypothetical protein EYR40_010168 [Pleurotus pulmonarius]
MDATMDGDSYSHSSNEDYYYNYYCCGPADLHYSYSDDSSMSAPSKKGAAGVHNRTRPNMDSALKTGLSNLVVRDVDVEEYVQYVYGVSKNDILYIQSKKWELKGLSTYTEMLDKGANEDALYEPFKNIMGDIFETLAKDGRKIDIHHASLVTKELKGTANVRKPDQLFFFGSHTDEMPVTWSLSKAFVEFAVTPKSQRIKGAKFGQKFTTIKGGVAIAVRSAPDAPTAPATIFSTPDLASPPDLAASPTIPSTPTRTKRHSTGDADERPAKRPKLGPLTGKAPQAAGYADIKQSGQDGVEYTVDVGPGVWSHFKVTGDPLYVYGGVTGRGSHVLPGRLIPTSEKDIPSDAVEGAEETKSPAILTNSEMVNANRLSALQTNAGNAVEIEKPTTEMDLLAMRRWDEDQDDDESLTSAPPVPTINPAPAPPSDHIDFETLGDCLTFQNFMAALGSRPIGIPKKYQAYAKSLLEESLPRHS